MNILTLALSVFGVVKCLGADPAGIRVFDKKSVAVPFFGGPIASVTTENRSLGIVVEERRDGVWLSFGSRASAGKQLMLGKGRSIRSPFVDEALGEIWSVVWRNTGSGRFPEFLLRCFKDENGKEGVSIYSVELEGGGEILNVVAVRAKQIDVIVRSPSAELDEGGFGYFIGRVNRSELVERVTEDNAQMDSRLDAGVIRGRLESSSGD